MHFLEFEFFQTLYPNLQGVLPNNSEMFWSSYVTKMPPEIPHPLKTLVLQVFELCKPYFLLCSGKASQISHLEEAVARPTVLWACNKACYKFG